MMSGSSPGRDDSSSYNTSANLSDITADQSLLINFTSRNPATMQNGQEDALFGSINDKLKSTPKHTSKSLQTDTTIIDISDDSSLLDSSLLISSESGNGASDEYGKRKRSDSEDSIPVLTGTGGADESGNSLEFSDRDTSAKDESDFSADGIEDGTLSPQPSNPKTEDEFPSTVAILQTNDGAKVYVVGTAHFSEESQDDVSKVIRKVQPHIIMLELCSQRINILKLDEKTILEEAKNIHLKKIKSIIEQNGVFNSLMYILLLNMSAYITKQLGIAPGGEFRRALQEANTIPNCIIHLGDRPIQITMHRALSALSWWQMIKLIWKLMTNNEPISKEDVEQCKQRSMLKEMLADMEKEFPALKKVFLEERDTYLTHSLQIAASTKSNGGPVRVVGVVGIGHLQGITENWGKVPTKAIAPIMKIPPPSRSSQILKVTFKLTVIGLIGYVGYRVMPKQWLP